MSLQLGVRTENFPPFPDNSFLWFFAEIHVRLLKSIVQRKVMKWDEAFCIGCNTIDLQHQKLVQYVDKLELTCSNQTSDVYDALQFLIDYARTHFADEERIMAAIDFPCLSDQKLMHDEFIDFITGILLDLKNGKLCDLDELLEYLKNWIIQHILQEDKKIGDHLRINKYKCEVIE